MKLRVKSSLQIGARVAGTLPREDCVNPITSIFKMWLTPSQLLKIVLISMSDRRKNQVFIINAVNLQIIALRGNQ